MRSGGQDREAAIGELWLALRYGTRQTLRLAESLSEEMEGRAGVAALRDRLLEIRTELDSMHVSRETPFDPIWTDPRAYLPSFDIS